MRFLVVDDFLTMRRVLRSFLREMGHDDVVEAADGHGALEQMRAAPVDFVITDIEMPAMNGFELLSAIKRDKALRHVPVLMVAAEVRKDDLLRSVRDGAAGYVVKPFTRELLEQKLRVSAPALFAVPVAASE